MNDELTSMPQTTNPYGLSLKFLHERPRQEAIGLLQDAGFRHIELTATEGHFGDWLADPEAARRDLDAAGLAVWSVHSPGASVNLGAIDEADRQRAVDAAIGCFAPARRVGAQVVVVHCNKPGQIFEPDDYDASLARTRKSLVQIAPAAKEAGIQMAVENMIPRPIRRPACDMQEVLGLIAGLGEHVGVCLDTGHNHVTGAAVHEQAMLAGEKLFTLHIHDNHGQMDRDEHLIPGEGTIDWPAFLAALDRIGFASPRTFEVVHRGGAETATTALHRLADIARQWSKHT